MKSTHAIFPSVKISNTVKKVVKLYKENIESSHLFWVEGKSLKNYIAPLIGDTPKVTRRDYIHPKPAKRVD